MLLRVIGTFFSAPSLSRQSVLCQKGLSNIVKKSYCTSLENLPLIFMFTKENCSVCDEAKIALKPYRHRFHLKEVDITLPENDLWYEKYKYDIPVFHMFEDFLFKHKVDISILEKALTDYERR